MINRWLTNIQEWLLPRLCPACGSVCESGSRGLCSGCEQWLPSLVQSCPVCALPYENTAIRGVCGRCQQHPPAFHSAVCLYHYAPPVDHFIRAIKYHRDLGLARLLGQRLAEKVTGAGWRPDVILPVPLHPARLRSRGFNQAVELARPAAKGFDLRPASAAVERVRDTPPQSRLSSSQRRKNLRGAFRVRRDFSGQTVAIVDDVMTTGSTVDALAAVLRRAGAREIRIWVIARA
jgi:ComF family protein